MDQNVNEKEIFYTESKTDTNKKNFIVYTPFNGDTRNKCEKKWNRKGKKRKKEKIYVKICLNEHKECGDRMHVEIN